MEHAEFEWDPRKAASNAKKHGVTFEEALTAFRDPAAPIFDDPDHSVDEVREILVGVSSRMRLLVVGFSARRHRVRLIFARRATAGERKRHEAHATHR